ncbi:MAG: hypothetical protein DMF90_17940 [Acidobacteria bacterium]|nr:MAG: hypothetical protein DMF90_17940 [Acidobacteriota bacterium]
MTRIPVKTSALSAAVAVFLLSATDAHGAPDGRDLTEAVKARDVQAVRELLRQRVDVNTPLADKTTPLHWASHWDDLDTATTLLRAGARANAADDDGTTPLLLASVNGSAPMVRMLLEAGADAALARRTGVTPLMMAARTGNVEVVRALLDHGAAVNARESTHGQTALMWAVAQNHTASVQALLDRGADVHARTPPRRTRTAVSGQFAGSECCLPNCVGGFTALLFAAQQGHIEPARLLLASGADVNDTAADGSSALVLAIDSAPVVSERVARNALASHALQEAMARFLLERGADPTLHGSGRTALHSAVQRKMSRLVPLLLERGAAPNARLERRLPSLSRDVGLQNGLDVNTIGATPFWLAASYGDVESMRLLLKSWPRLRGRRGQVRRAHVRPGHLAPGVSGSRGRRALSRSGRRRQRRERQRPDRAFRRRLHGKPGARPAAGRPRRPPRREEQERADAVDGRRGRRVSRRIVLHEEGRC